MKTRKKLQLLRGITAIRVKAGITQAALAQWLGISKSLVSMVENNHRSLPPAALLKLSELELQFQQQQGNEAPFRLPAYTPSTAAASTRRLKESIRRSHLEQLRYRLNRMQELHVETLASLQYLHRMQAHTAGLTFNMLELEKRKLLKRLDRCNDTAFATIKGKMAMLEIVLESYRTDDCIKVSTQTAGDKTGVDHSQKQAYTVAPEIIDCKASLHAGIEAAA